MKLREWLQAASNYLDLRSTVSPLADSQQSLDSWFHSAHGQFLLQRERQALEQLIPQPGAHRMLYLGRLHVVYFPGTIITSTAFALVPHQHRQAVLRQLLTLMPCHYPQKPLIQCCCTMRWSSQNIPMRY